MTTQSIREALMGISTEEVTRQAALSDMPRWIRERYPLIQFIGTFTGETGTREETTAEGNTVSYDTLIFENVKVIEAQYDQQSHLNDDTFEFAFRLPKEARQFPTSAIGRMLSSAKENKVTANTIFDLKGKPMLYTLDAKLPWRTATSPIYFYSVAPAAGEAQPSVAIAEEHIVAALELASGQSATDFSKNAPKALLAQPGFPPELVTKIVRGQFVTEMKTAGRLAEQDGILAKV